MTSEQLEALKKDWRLRKSPAGKWILEHHERDGEWNVMGYYVSAEIARRAIARELGENLSDRDEYTDDPRVLEALNWHNHAVD